ncbi:uncharacterized protein [Rhodnius prolixus]
MKFLYSALLFVICTVSADEAAFKLKGKPQKALLIFPPPLTVQNETTTESVQNETERADNVTDSVLERFKQLQGSITNVYYISLPDGKLEKLEYIRAPSGLLQETQESQSKDPVSTNYQPTFNQYRQSSAPTASNKLQGNQQTNHQIVFGTNKHSNQANQQQYNQVPQQFRVSNQLSSQFSSQYNADNSQNKPSSYVASVQFTDVPPVHGPVFPYTTSPYVRIVRYANNVQ